MLQQSTKGLNTYVNVISDFFSSINYPPQKCPLFLLWHYENWKHLSPSLALSTSCQRSSQITAPVHSPSVNIPSPYCSLFILLLCTPVSLLAHSSSAHLPFQCLIAILKLLCHHVLFIALTPLSYLICTPVSLFAHSSSAHLPFVFNCYIVITSPPWPIYCHNSLILPHLHSLYIDFLFSFDLLYY